MSDEAPDVTVFSGKVTPDWIERGVFLSKAALHFGNPGFVNSARAAAERFKELRDGETTEMFEASSRLWGAARDQELLTLLHGDQKKAWLDYYTNCDAAERDLWFKLEWGETLLAFGANGTPNKEPEWIPAQTWFWLYTDPAKNNVVSGEGMKYYYVCVVDPRLYSNSPSAPRQPPPAPRPARTAASTRKTGPRPDKKEAVKVAMLNEINSGELTRAQLDEIPKKKLPSRFPQGGETTCYEARKLVRQTPTNCDQTATKD
jgi:hypothetical protein